jgi:hypothetical protein
MFVGMDAKICPILMMYARTEALQVLIRAEVSPIQMSLDITETLNRLGRAFLHSENKTLETRHVSG